MKDGVMGSSCMTLCCHIGQTTASCQYGSCSRVCPEGRTFFPLTLSEKRATLGNIRIGRCAPGVVHGGLKLNTVIPFRWKRRLFFTGKSSFAWALSKISLLRAGAVLQGRVGCRHLFD